MAAALMPPPVRLSSETALTIAGNESMRRRMRIDEKQVLVTDGIRDKGRGIKHL
jgi:hypothetical protein